MGIFNRIFRGSDKSEPADPRHDQLSAAVRHMNNIGASIDLAYAKVSPGSRAESLSMNDAISLLTIMRDGVARRMSMDHIESDFDGEIVALTWLRDNHPQLDRVSDAQELLRRREVAPELVSKWISVGGHKFPPLLEAIKSGYPEFAYRLD